MNVSNKKLTHAVIITSSDQYAFQNRLLVCGNPRGKTFIHVMVKIVFFAPIKMGSDNLYSFYGELK
jgi:hypothetical protein